MSHANKTHSSLEFDHDRSINIPSKDTQPPIPHHKIMIPQGGFFDRETQVYWTKQYRQFWATAPATAVAVLAGAPFENVKTRMQSKHFDSIPGAFKYTYKTEGIRGFWAGTWPPLISITANRIASFLVYRKAKYAIDDYVVKPAWGESAIKHSNDFGNYPNLWTNLCYVPAGMLSGAATTIFLTPVELVKNAAQTSVIMSGRTTTSSGERAARVGSYRAAKQIIQQRGIGALWTGFRLHFVRDVAGSGIYFGAYEIFKQSFGTYFRIEEPNASWVPGVAGGLAGLVGWTLTYPLDTSKTRAQNSLLNGAPKPSIKTSSSQVLEVAAKTIPKVSNWHGVEMIIVRSIVQNMIQMTGFERIKIWIDDLEFANGSKSLPGIERDRGKDSKKKPNL